MLKNYIKITLRQLRTNSSFSLLNMFGLALGLSCAILILLWIQDEKSYDRFHARYDRIYEVLENETHEGKVYSYASTPGPLAAALRSEIPEIANAARNGWGDNWLFANGEKECYARGNYADPSFLEMFSFDVLYGSKQNPFPDDRSIVLSESTSTKLFGTANSVGKYVKINNREAFLVTAVMKDAPANSTLHYDWLASFRLFEKAVSWSSEWTTNGLITYVELKSPADKEKVNRKIEHFIHNKDKEAGARPFLMAMEDWRLRSNFENGKQADNKSRIQYVKIFGVISVLLILIACINFMNLSTARASKRAKEVGVRKAIGAGRSALVGQFLGESMVIALVAMMAACMIVFLALPYFNTFVEKQLSLNFRDPSQWLLFIGLALVCGLISGSYPAFYLSSFKPASIFKGVMHERGSGALFIRRGLVVTQFITSLVLVIGTLIIYAQVNHIKSRDLGYNRNNLLRMDLNETIRKHLDVVKQGLLQTGYVTNAATGNMIINIGGQSDAFSWPGKPAAKNILIGTDAVTNGFIATAGMKLLEGRDFNVKSENDSASCIINNTFAKMINAKQDVLNTRITFSGSEFKVTGIIEDFVYNTMWKDPEPMAYFCFPNETNTLFIRIKENADLETALEKIKASLKITNPGYPFEYKFIDDEINKKLANEALISKLSFLFAMLTIAISCIGLFGLAAYTAERRTKEVGIRKILGASVTNLVSLLSKDFLKLVSISFVIACPVAWYIMQRWLQDYAYRIEIGAWVFIAAGMLAFVIAFITVSTQAIKAAIANPVKSLRTE